MITLFLSDFFFPHNF